VTYQTGASDEIRKELRLIVDALDNKRQFQLQSGEGRVE
jgi:hypothetical protein